MANRPTNKADWQNGLKQKLKGRQIRLFDLLANGQVLDRDELAYTFGFESFRTTKGLMN
jgi:hypothetical protein